MIKNTENTGFIQLGDNIYLKGFNEMDNASMIILKKIIGTHIKRINEKIQFSRIDIECDIKDENYSMKIILYLSSADKKSYSSNEKNLFVCIDSVFKKIN